MPLITPTERLFTEINNTTTYTCKIKNQNTLFYKNQKNFGDTHCSIFLKAASLKTFYFAHIFLFVCFNPLMVKITPDINNSI